MKTWTESEYKHVELVVEANVGDAIGKQVRISKTEMKQAVLEAIEEESEDGFRMKDQLDIAEEAIREIAYLKHAKQTLGVPFEAAVAKDVHHERVVTPSGKKGLRTTIRLVFERK